MALLKEIIVLGDVELGAGNLTDDFIADRKLIQLINEQTQKKYPVDLVLNGDTFDFLKCPSRLKPETFYPRKITEEVSLAKLRLVRQAHSAVFDALKEFVKEKEHYLYFVLGNHDHDLVYEEVQKELRNIIGHPENKEKVRFPGLKYLESGVYVEHGQQYDILFKVNFEKLFLKHKGETFLNFPFVSFGFLGPFMHFKEANPFIDRIFPRPALLTHHQVIARKLNKYTIKYFLKSLLYYPFRFYADPTYTFPTGLAREFYKRLRTVHWDVDNIAAIFMKKSKVRKKIVVLGHIHEKYVTKGRKRTVIIPGSWRDEYDFNPKTRELVPRSKRYVQIFIFDNKKPQYHIMDLPRERKILYFDDVIQDEKKFVELAKEEEELRV